MRTLFLTTAMAFTLAALPLAAVAQNDGQTTATTTTQTASEANAAVPPRTEATVTTRTTEAGQQEVITTTRGNATPPPASAMGKDYPICRGAVQDGCQNAGEGGAPGRSRALDHWPGAPASELKAARKAKPSG